MRSFLAPLLGTSWIVHRLDRETSGVMVLARSLSAHKQLNLQFEHRQVEKTYHAWILGHPSWASLQVEVPLKVNADRRHRTVPSLSLGKAASTSFRVLQQFTWGCLVEAKPHTGYTHQIRSHLAFTGFPILGDDLYQALAEKKNRDLWPLAPAFNRVALHAAEIRFVHPETLEAVCFRAPYPQDISVLFETPF